jgi:diguanylate cyclase (GGDEF)-like protein
VIKARSWWLLLADENAPGSFHVRAVDTGTESLTGRTLRFTGAELFQFQQAPQGYAMGRSGRPIPAALLPVDIESVFVLPILLGGEVGGMIVVGGARDGGPDADEIGLLQDLADRVAVALATAARDRELYRRAHFDPLTQLPNRLLFLEEIGRELARAERTGKSLAVLFIDLDGFSQVNDSLGHAAGDQMLTHVAARLRGCLRKADIVARLGGDEFTVALAELREPSDVAAVAQQLIDALSQSYDIGHGETFITASIGIAMYPTDGTSAQDLLQRADMAMYRAKARGRGRHVFFEDAMNREVQARFTLDRELRRALEEQQFVLFYQPQLDLRTSRIVGAEALIRWQHPARGLVAPGPFIGFAEETGLIERIGEWALRTACHQFMQWQAIGLPLEHVSVNVSPRQFRGRDFVETVAVALRVAGMAPERLRLEITESVLVDDSGAAEATLARLKELGTPLELDDFGTGYSSLAYLQRLPVATIKLDRSFITGIGADDNARAIAHAAITMAHALDKEIVAEGVETDDQLALLRRWGCDAIQGFLLSRPIPAADFAHFVRDTAVIDARSGREPPPTDSRPMRLIHTNNR